MHRVVLLLLVGAIPALAQGRGPDRAPAEGSAAPDFQLQLLDAEGKPSEERVKLSEVAKTRPVALVFGSYT